MKKSPLASAISFSMLAISAVGWVQAQEEEAGAHRGLEQVIVQARRVEENVQDVPLAITAMSAEQLEKAGVTNVADLTKNAPSVQLSNATGRQEAAFFAIRGQRADDILLTSDQSVAVIVSGVPVNWGYGVGLMGALDISSLEVAKGPQGTLFGKNSTGGAIIITPAEPDQAFGGKIKAGVGNYNLRELEGMVNAPITDTLAGRVAASATKRDGWGDNLDGGNDFNSTDNWSARASLKWQPTDALSSLFVVEGGYSSTSGPLTKQIATNPKAPLGGLYNQVAESARQNDSFWEGHADAAHGGYNDMKTWGVLNTTTYEVSPELTLKNIAGVRDLRYAGLADIDGTNGQGINVAPPAFLPFLPPAVQALNHLTSLAAQSTYAQSVTEELQVIGSQDLADWIAGLYYSHTDGTDGSVSQQFNGVGNLVVSGPTGGVTNQTVAAFTQSTWHLTDKLNATTGLRYTMDNREVTYESERFANPPYQSAACLLSINTAAGPAVPSPCSIQKDKSFHEPTWNLSVDYKLTDSQMVYAATRHGYRSGGFPGRGANAETTKPFDPEKVNDVELGYKIESDIAGMPFRVNAAAFYQSYKDIQRNITLVDANNVLQNTVRNAAGGTIQGGEIEFTFLPIDSLELKGYFSYVDAGYDSWDDINTVTKQPLDRSSNAFPGIPQESGSLTARYTLPLPASVGEVSASANVYYQSETALYVDNAVDGTGNECVGGKTGSYKVYNGRVDWDGVMGLEGLSMAAWGKNLANEEYYVSGLCLYNTVGYAAAYPGEPRTFGISAAYKF